MFHVRSARIKNVWVKTIPLVLASFILQLPLASSARGADCECRDARVRSCTPGEWHAAPKNNAFVGQNITKCEKIPGDRCRQVIEAKDFAEIKCGTEGLAPGEEPTADVTLGVDCELKSWGCKVVEVHKKYPCFYWPGQDGVQITQPCLTTNPRCGGSCQYATLSAKDGCKQVDSPKGSSCVDKSLGGASLSLASPAASGSSHS